MMVGRRLWIAFLVAGGCSSDSQSASPTGAPPTGAKPARTILKDLQRDIDAVSPEIPRILTLQEAAIQEYRLATSDGAREAALKTQEDLNRRMRAPLARLGALRDKATTEAAGTAEYSGERPKAGE